MENVKFVNVKPVGEFLLNLENDKRDTREIAKDLEQCKCVIECLLEQTYYERGNETINSFNIEAEDEDLDASIDEFAEDFE